MQDINFINRNVIAAFIEQIKYKVTITKWFNKEMECCLLVEANSTNVSRNLLIQDGEYQPQFYFHLFTLCSIHN